MKLNETQIRNVVRSVIAEQEGSAASLYRNELSWYNNLLKKLQKVDPEEVKYVKYVVAAAASITGAGDPSHSAKKQRMMDNLVFVAQKFGGEDPQVARPMLEQIVEYEFDKQMNSPRYKAPPLPARYMKK